MSGLSSLHFSRGSGTITLIGSDGHHVGTFPAGNNTASNSNGPWPNGTYPYLYHVDHPESGEFGPYGSYGNYVFDVPNKIGMGVHSGRQGPNSKTMGCVRTTDEAVHAIEIMHAIDPLTSITIGD